MFWGALDSLDPGRNPTEWFMPMAAKKKAKKKVAKKKTKKAKKKK
jgi:hypothetical protein